MASLPNKVLIAGHILQKPELRKAANGASMTDLQVAVHQQRHENLEGETMDGSIHVVVWGAQAEQCVKMLDISSSVLVEGTLQLDIWLSKEGKKRTQLRVTAEKIQITEKIAAAL